MVDYKLEEVKSEIFEEASFGRLFTVLGTKLPDWKFLFTSGI